MRFALLILLLVANTLYAQDEWADVQRVVAIGDLHGDYDQYVKILKQNQLVNSKLRWTGGETHLVQLGDVPDRGPDSLKIIRHLMKLGKQAKRAGGRVHPLIGNHEAMNIKGDLRYVHPGEFEVLVSRKSKRLQQRYIDQVINHFKETRPELLEDPALETRLLAQYPLGYVEHRQLWQPGQEIAAWVADNNTVIRIDRTLFVHGGINPHEPLRPIGEINREIRDALSGNRNESPDNYADSDTGPLWYRGLAKNDATIELEPLKAMLAFYDADRIVVAHTPTSSGNVTLRLDGLVVMADTGISGHYGGHLANLEILENNVECELFNVTKEGRQCLK